MRILLVEDDGDGGAALVAALNSLFSSSPSEVVHVSTLKQACAALGDSTFDVCLVDLGLPDANGLEAPQELMQRVPDVPIVVLTGDDSHRNAMKLAQSGVQDYLVKGECSVQQINLALQLSIERKNIENRLRRDASTDQLTGLVNRRSINDQLLHAIAQADRTQKCAAVLVIDLDTLKSINDSYGHAIGDLAILETGRLIKRSVRMGDVVGRIGGDEFCVVLEHLESIDAATAVARKVATIVAAYPFSAQGVALSLSASVGLSVYPDQARSPELLLSLADEAMYANKRANRNNATVPASTD